MKPSWTEEQQQVIDLQNRNILVSAAAGSGKTAVLVERIIQKITREEEPCDIDRLLVVTFTRAAAAEMRARIGNALEQKLQEYPENQQLQKQASLLHTAQITTIDGFCQNIIRNYFHVIRLDPAFRVGDETELKLMKQELLQELLEEKYRLARECKDETFGHFTEAFAPGRTDSAIEELVLSLFELSNSYPWPEEWLKDCNKMYHITSLEEFEESEWVKNLVSYLAECMRNFLELAHTAERICMESDGPTNYLQAIQSDIQYLNELQGLSTYQEYASVLAGYNPATLKAVRGKAVAAEKKEVVKNLRSKYLKGGVDKLRSKFFSQSPKEQLEDIQAMAPFVEELIDLVVDFRKAFAAKKQEEGLIDFSDMEHFALDILVVKDENGIHPSETALELQEYYDEILTDEYQDSNYVQDLLLTSLCRAPEQKPFLFMVGDVKQSIYKFRLARPELFMEKYDSYAVGQGPYQRIDLHRNFRSRASVLESANFIFERIMQKNFGGIVYDECAKLVPGAQFEDAENRTADQTEILLIERQSEEEVLEKKQLEAAVIGQKIRDMVQGENPLYVKDKAGYRPVRYGDIAILLRSLSGWSEDFLETLNDMGIPAYSETKTGYFTTLEVETILNFLCVIDNPRQDIPLAAVLRSVLVELTDEELAWIGTLPEEINFWDKIQNFLGLCEWKQGNLEIAQEFATKGIDLEKLSEGWKLPEKETAVLQEKLLRFCNRRREYQSIAKTKSVYELLRRIYDETGYYQIMSAMPAGEKRRANLDVLLQQAVEFAQIGQRGIFAFTRYIENLKKSDIDFGEASLANENMDAVRIMTIHKSKGLEFPVVFVAGMGKQFNLTDARKATILNGDYGVGCDFVDLELRVKQPTLIKRFLANDIVLSTLAEEIRVLYVALTRAKEKLFISGTVKGLPKKLDTWRANAECLDYYQLTTAQTYLDWLIPAVARRPAIQSAIADYLEYEEIPWFCSKKDNLFAVEFFAADEIILEGKAEEIDNALQYERLQKWNTEITYDDSMRHALEEQQNYQYPYAYDENVPVKVSVSELKRREMMRLQRVVEEEILTVKDKEVTEIPRPSFMKEKKEVSGAARGTLYHLVMEHFPYEEIAASGMKWGRKEFDAYLDRMVQIGYMSSEEKDLLRVERFVIFMDSAIGQRMANASARGELRLEQPFMMGVTAEDIGENPKSQELVMVQGIIDAFFFEGNEIILVDYKTDAVQAGQENELAEKYRAQLDYYAQALERLVGKKVSEKIIYSFALGKEIIL